MKKKINVSKDERVLFQSVMKLGFRIPSLSRNYKIDKIIN
jgi:hypothetical protein